MDAEYRFVLTGKTPILFSANNVVEKDEWDAWIKDPEHKKLCKRGDDRTPPWTWQIRLHHDGKHLAIPQEVVMRTLAGAGAKVPTGRGTQTFKAISQSGLFITEEFCRFTADGKQVPLTAIRAMKDDPFSVQAEKVRKLGGQLFVKPVSVNNSKHVRVRARFDRWSVDGIIVVRDPLIEDVVLRRMFAIAGKYCGFLDWRPSSRKFPGPFGQFEAELTPLGKIAAA